MRIQCCKSSVCSYCLLFIETKFWKQQSPVVNKHPVLVTVYTVETYFARTAKLEHFLGVLITDMNVL